jgi:prevent-host-death family protein
MNKSDMSHDCSPLLIDGEPIDTSSFTATDAKNAFAHVLEMVTAGRAVVITKHDTPKAVMLSYEEFMGLSDRGVRQLNTLSAEFDALLTSMQQPKARAGIKKAFKMSPVQSGKAAVAAGKKRRRS